MLLALGLSGKMRSGPRHYSLPLLPKRLLLLFATPSTMMVLPLTPFVVIVPISDVSVTFDVEQTLMFLSLPKSPWVPWVTVPAVMKNLLLAVPSVLHRLFATLHGGWWPESIPVLTTLVLWCVPLLLQVSTPCELVRYVLHTGMKGVPRDITSPTAPELKWLLLTRCTPVLYVVTVFALSFMVRKQQLGTWLTAAMVERIAAVTLLWWVTPPVLFLVQKLGFPRVTLSRRTVLKQLLFPLYETSPM